jgi:hypothetical protein
VATRLDVRAVLARTARSRPTVFSELTGVALTRFAADLTERDPPDAAANVARRRVISARLSGQVGQSTRGSLVGLRSTNSTTALTADIFDSPRRQNCAHQPPSPPSIRPSSTSPSSRWMDDHGLGRTHRDPQASPAGPRTLVRLAGRPQYVLRRPPHLRPASNEVLRQARVLARGPTSPTRGSSPASPTRA